MKENIEGAIDSLDFARSDILGALSHADPVEALLIEDLLTGLMPVINNAKKILCAIEAKNKEQQ